MTQTQPARTNRPQGLVPPGPGAGVPPAQQGAGPGGPGIDPQTIAVTLLQLPPEVLQAVLQLVAAGAQEQAQQGQAAPAA